MTRAVLEIVRASAEHGIAKEALVADVLERFSSATPALVRRHLSRMTSGRYRGRLVLGPDRVYRWAIDRPSDDDSHG